MLLYLPNCRYFDWLSTVVRANTNNYWTALDNSIYLDTNIYLILLHDYSF